MWASARTLFSYLLFLVHRLVMEGFLVFGSFRNKAYTYSVIRLAGFHPYELPGGNAMTRILERSEIRRILMDPYAGMLDPTRPAHWRIEPLVGPFGQRMLAVYAYDDVVRILSANDTTGGVGDEFSHDILPPWMRLEMRRILHPVMNGPVTQPAGAAHLLGRTAIQGMVAPGVVRSVADGAFALAQELVATSLKKNGFIDVAWLADRVTYDTIMRIMDADDMLTDAARLQFYRDTDKVCNASSPFTIPLQLLMRRRETRMLKARAKAGRNQPIDAYYATFPDMAQKRGAKKFLKISSTVTTSYAICATIALLMSMDTDAVLRELCVSGTQAEWARAYHNGLGFATPSPRRPAKALEDLVIAGFEVKAGQLVEGHFSSANRNFPGAHVFDPQRAPKDAPHIAFGLGAYECPGQSLSRTNFLAVATALAPHLADLKVRSLKTRTGIIYRTSEFVLAA